MLATALCQERPSSEGLQGKQRQRYGGAHEVQKPNKEDNTTSECKVATNRRMSLGPVGISRQIGVKGRSRDGLLDKRTISRVDTDEIATRKKNTFGIGNQVVKVVRLEQRRRILMKERQQKARVQPRRICFKLSGGDIFILVNLKLSQQSTLTEGS